MNQIVNEQIIFPEPFNLVFETSTLEEPLQDHDVLVRTLYSIISPGTELSLFVGSHIAINDPNNRYAKYPFLPGYSLMGEVVAIGKSVEDYHVGEIVYSTGYHAKYNIVSTNEEYMPLIKLDDMDVGEKSTFINLGLISMTAVLQSNFQIGDTAVVLGMGLIGNLAAQLLSIRGAEVVAVDVDEERLKIAQKTGIKNTILSDGSMDLSKSLKKLTGLDKADIIVEATGSPNLIIPALDLAKPLGQVLALGCTRENIDLNVYEYIHRKGVHFIGAHGNMHGPEGFNSRMPVSHYVLKLIELGALIIDPLITHKLPYWEAERGYDMLLNQQSQALGVLLDWRNEKPSN